MRCIRLKVHRDEVEVGCIIENDIMGLTKNPIVPKNTVINEEHIKILQAFNIAELTIEKTKVDGSIFRPKQFLSSKKETEDSKTNNQSEENTNFTGRYLKSIQEYKKEFINWQSGMAVNVAKMRELTLPLLKLVDQDKSYLYLLNQYSNKKDYHFHHAIAVSILSGMLGKKLGLPTGQINQLALAGVLADCGMAKVTPSILKKEQPLTENEFKEVKLHTANGYKMIKDTPLLKPETKLAVFQHHERFDGTGYPTSEKNDRIHLYSQIVGISDVFHAMTSERIYRRKQPIFKVLDMISKDLFGKFDIKVVNALLQLLGDLRIGTQVKLSTGQTGEVVYTKANTFTRPLIRLNKTEELVDLSQISDVYISEILSH